MKNSKHTILNYWQHQKSNLGMTPPQKKRKLISKVIRNLVNIRQTYYLSQKQSKKRQHQNTEHLRNFRFNLPS